MDIENGEGKEGKGNESYVVLNKQIVINSNSIWVSKAPTSMTLHNAACPVVISIFISCRKNSLILKDLQGLPLEALRSPIVHTVDHLILQQCFSSRPRASLLLRRASESLPRHPLPHPLILVISTLMYAASRLIDLTLGRKATHSQQCDFRCSPRTLNLQRSLFRTHHPGPLSLILSAP